MGLLAELFLIQSSSLILKLSTLVPPTGIPACSGYLLLIASHPLKRAFTIFDVKNHMAVKKKIPTNRGWEILSDFHAWKNRLYSKIS